MKGPEDSPGGPLPRRDLEQAVSLVGDWSPLQGACILMTGCTGFFGRWLLETLDEATRSAGLAIEVHALTRDAAAFRRRLPHLAAVPWLRLDEGDTRRFEPSAGRFTHVVHGAATSRASEYRARPLEMLSTIVDGTRFTLELARERGARRLLLVSSGAVYGPMPAGLTHFPEDARIAPDPLDKGTVYGQAKRLAEHLGALAAEEGSLVVPVARCFAFVGPGLPLDAHFAVGNFLRDALAGRPIRVGGDGTPLRSYLYGSELAAWLLTLLMRGRTRSYHVGSDRAVSILDLARTVGRLTGCPVEVARLPVPGAPIESYVPALGRVEEEFGLRPVVALEEALRRTLAWHGFPSEEGGPA